MPRGKPLTLADIDMDYIRARVLVSPETGCWVWQRAQTGNGWRERKGYGYFRLRGEGRGGFTAHRVVFYLTHGRWPNETRHTCDNKPCCNPEHLLDGTKSDNMRDAVERGLIRRVRGERAPSSRLTELKVLEIRRRYAGGGCTFRSLASDYGVGATTVRAVVARRTWTHI